jgi:hypothetical protein
MKNGNAQEIGEDKAAQVTILKSEDRDILLLSGDLHVRVYSVES